MNQSFVPAAGFFGKVPSRGDFVRGGLPADFVAPWDAWCQRMMSDSRNALGEVWEAAWLEAPVWCFALSPGACGEGAALGVWLPSVDRVGRYFPLTIAMAARCPLAELAARAGGFLDRVEQIGRDALEFDLTPADLARRTAEASIIGAPDPARTAFRTGWWTVGSPRVASAHHAISGLPGPACAERMLADPEMAP